MTNTKALIKFCEDLASDPTVELTQSARAEFRGLMFRSIGEIHSVERELGPQSAVDEQTKVKSVLDPIRARIFGNA